MLACNFFTLYMAEIFITMYISSYVHFFQSAVPLYCLSVPQWCSYTWSWQIWAQVSALEPNLLPSQFLAGSGISWRINLTVLFIEIYDYLLNLIWQEKSVAELPSWTELDSLSYYALNHALKILWCALCANRHIIVPRYRCSSSYATAVPAPIYCLVHFKYCTFLSLPLFPVYRKERSLITILTVNSLVRSLLCL